MCYMCLKYHLMSIISLLSLHVKHCRTKRDMVSAFLWPDLHYSRHPIWQHSLCLEFCLVLWAALWNVVTLLLWSLFIKLRLLFWGMFFLFIIACYMKTACCIKNKTKQKLLLGQSSSWQMDQTVTSQFNFFSHLKQNLWTPNMTWFYLTFWGCCFAYPMVTGKQLTIQSPKKA